MSAAPEAVTKDAAIYDVGAGGKMRTVREGTNGWWCMADTPLSPGPDPKCGDANSIEWAMAWIEKRDPPKRLNDRIHAMYVDKLDGLVGAAFLRSNVEPVAQ